VFVLPNANDAFGQQPPHLWLTVTKPGHRSNELAGTSGLLISQMTCEKVSRHLSTAPGRHQEVIMIGLWGVGLKGTHIRLAWGGEHRGPSRDEDTIRRCCNHARAQEP
jgi:hypothetical protein